MNFDVKCDKCSEVWTETKEYKAPSKECPKCGSNFTRTLMTLVRCYKAKDPYDLI